MNNLTLRTSGVISPTSLTEAYAIARVIELVEQRGEHVVHRVKLRLFRGLVRPSYAVRLKLFLPFLRWLLAEAQEAAEIPTTESTE